MNEEERYRFDLQGYLKIENAIEAETVYAMNQWFEEKAETDPEFAGRDGETIKVFELLTWGPQFLNLLDNPRVLPYLKEMCGDRLRLDHDYGLISRRPGPKLTLHGGGTPYDASQYYHCRDGKFYNGLIVAVYALTDTPPGAGGFCCIPGSHKSAFRCPEDIRVMDRESDLVQAVPCKAGDCIVFTEALTHGTLPWQAETTRRALFYKYSPGHMTWARTYYTPAPGNPALPELEPRLNETQRILLDPPSVDRHRRV